jgi:hypothetical protein
MHRRLWPLAYLCLAVLTGPLLLAQRDYRPTPGEIPPPDEAPPVVTPGEGTSPPTDAIVLFDGTDLSKWDAQKGGEPRWKVANGYMEVVEGTGDIVSKEAFGDVQLHVEWATPAEIKGEGRGHGNSGVFLQDRYEVQVFNSYENPIYFHGMAGSVYKQYAPLVNAARKPGEWQTYDIVFRAPQFDDSGKVIKAAYLTLFWNGILVQDRVEVRGTTTHNGAPSYKAYAAEQPLSLQEHGDPVRFRNIWVRRLRVLRVTLRREGAKRNAPGRQVERRSRPASMPAPTPTCPAAAPRTVTRSLPGPVACELAALCGADRTRAARSQTSPPRCRLPTASLFTAPANRAGA